MTDRFPEPSESDFKNMKTNLVIEWQLLNTVITKCRDLSVYLRSVICHLVYAPMTNHDILLNRVQYLLISLHRCCISILSYEIL